MAISATEREMVGQTLNTLPPEERQKCLRRAAKAALHQLSLDEEKIIENFARELSKDIRGLGPTGALEIIAAVGRRLPSE